MDQVKINHVVNAFFTSLRAEEDRTLETGLTHNNTVEVLRQAVLGLIEKNPKRFQQYIKFFEEGCMYLQDDSEEIPEVDKNER